MRGIGIQRAVPALRKTLVHVVTSDFVASNWNLA